MCFVFWGPKDAGPNQDHPFQNNLQGLPGALSTVGSLFRTSIFYVFGGPIVTGGGPRD